VKGEITMTYNWNTMVEITVPTGTNGWLYSGEVIINGVKVRFPVGVPTSVPEPAAVLLKKMIELEQEEERHTLRAAVARLAPRERLIIELRFGFNGKQELTQKEVADLLGISQSYISRLEKKIIAELRGEIAGKI
jgi:RNA polymerase sigma factor (sigma-70 family)